MKAPRIAFALGSEGLELFSLNLQVEEEIYLRRNDDLQYRSISQFLRFSGSIFINISFSSRLTLI